MKIFDLDGPVYRVGNELADFMLLSIMFVIGCIPIVTIGTSTSALFYVYGKKIRKEDSYICRDFVKSYKQNLKQSILMTIILLITWTSAGAYLVNGYIPIMFVVPDGIVHILYSGFTLFFCVEVIVLTTYAFAILSRFHLKVKDIFVLSFVFTNKHLITGFFMLCLNVISVIIIAFIPPTLLIIPGMLCYVNSYFINSIFAKTINNPQEDQEDIEEKQIPNKRDISDIYEEKAIYSLKDIQALNSNESQRNA
ncbi:hypothetical protein AN641_02425 [Candidatus Epulonipiscioides gigas]|nr:hypothetical protein AN641_02425 [Epulopiscium sp. SCG-C07WGA-EpuloA2]